MEFKTQPICSIFILSFLFLWQTHCYAFIDISPPKQQIERAIQQTIENIEEPAEQSDIYYIENIESQTDSDILVGDSPIPEQSIINDACNQLIVSFANNYPFTQVSSAPLYRLAP